MKRRKFITAATAAGMSAPLTLAGSSGSQDQTNEIYELRSYELAWGGNQAALTNFLNEVEAPYLKKNGANHFMSFK